MRDLYRVICEIPENQMKLNWERRKKLKMNGDLAEIQEVNSSDQIGKLNVLCVSKCIRRSIIRIVGKERKFRKMKCRVCGVKFRRKKLTANMGILRWELRPGYGAHGTFTGIPDGVLNWMGICLRRGK